MNKKIKAISTALCGLVLMSGLWATNVKAQSNVRNVQSVQTSYGEIITMGFGAILSRDFYSDGSVKNAYVTFRPVDDAVRYRCYYARMETPTSAHHYIYDYSANQIGDGKIYVPVPKYDGPHFVTLVAYDSSGNIIRSEMYGYNFINGVITLNSYQKNPDLSQA